MHYQNKQIDEWQSDFISKATTIHNNKYDYSKVTYHNTHTPVDIICPHHGLFKKRPVKHLRDKEGCPVCSKINRMKNAARFKTFEDVVDVCNEKHQHQYTYCGLETDSLLYGEIITTNTKIIIECPHHGKFSQTINKHIYQGTGCRKCLTERIKKVRTKTTEQFIIDAVETHGSRYDYSKVEYHNAFSGVEIICPIHGSFTQIPANHTLHLQGCPNCNASGAEQAIHQFFQDNNIQCITQYSFDDCLSPKNKKLRFDFFLRNHNTLVEYDGIYHYEAIDHGDGMDAAKERLRYQQECDEIKNQYARDHGLTLIRIPYTHNKQLKNILSGIISS